MININNWKIFDKAGSMLNWTPDSYVNLRFMSDVGQHATGYLTSDPSGLINGAVMLNSGMKYDDSTRVFYNNAFNGASDIEITNDVSVNYADVSIFNPGLENVSSISGLSNINIDASGFNFPSSVYTAAVFLKPVSQGLIETEHLFLFQEQGLDLYYPSDSNSSRLDITVEDGDDEIQLFTVDEETQSVVWSDSISYDLTPELIQNRPIGINIGFRSDEEGVYERKVTIYNVINQKSHIVAEIIVNAESIGEDERFRDILGNFGLPDPKDFPLLFKEADINEGLPDYEIINPKSKQLILDQNKILPYIGTYKGLINAIKWLGYDDVYIREWFKNVKEDKKISLVVPYDATDRTQTILSFSADERKTLKKLNQLSLNYNIVKETGEIDEWGTPLTKNAFDYNIDEVFIKLFSLKTWLEKNIIGVNSKIIDVTGEGVYYERYKNLVYSTGNTGINYSDYQSVTPKTDTLLSELVNGDCSINLTLLEFQQTKIEDLNFKFDDFVDYVWDISSNAAISPKNPDYLTDSSLYVEIGAPISHPFVSMKDIQWKTQVSKPFSGVLNSNHTTSPLWVYDNTIRFYDINDTSILFKTIDNSITSLSVNIEKAFIRNASNDIWEDSIEYSIYPNYSIYIPALSSKQIRKSSTYSITEGSGTIYQYDTSTSYLAPYEFTVDSNRDNGLALITASTTTMIEAEYIINYLIESSTGVVSTFDDYIYLSTNNESVLQYSVDDYYLVPLLSMRDMETRDSSGNSIYFEQNKLYHLDILDGKIAMSDDSNENTVNSYVNFNYDNTSSEQEIRLNVDYTSPRMPLYVVDPSIYYWADPSGLSGGDDPSILAVDNSKYLMNVDHIGDYSIRSYTWDGFNIMYNNSMPNTHQVFMKTPIVYSLTDIPCNVTNEWHTQTCSMSGVDVSSMKALTEFNDKPIYDISIPFNNLTLKTNETTGESYINVPSITYFQENFEINSVNKFYNLTERVLEVGLGNSLLIDPDFQKFYNNDTVNIVHFDKTKYTMIAESSAYITSVSGDQLTVDNIPIGFDIDVSSDLYLINTSTRDVLSVSNSYNAQGDPISLIEIPSYAFLDNQVVSFIITDNSTSYSWGASYRVIEEPDEFHSFHIFENHFPLDSSSGLNGFSISAKHSYSVYTEQSNITVSSEEVDNNFELYVDSEYRHLFIDNTYSMINTLFDQSKTTEEWYDPSDNLINSDFYYRSSPVAIDSGSLIVLDASSQILNQKTIWTINNTVTQAPFLRVFNDSLPYVFQDEGIYSVLAETYDTNGNLSFYNYPGLITVK